ncbi:MAG TPA: TspO/MBR family protein [Sphingomicrobium sp.]
MAEAVADRGWPKFALITVPLIVIAGSASGLLSNSGYGNGWFNSLLKPPFMPPGWAFPVAWTTLYILMGVALAMVLAAPATPTRRMALALFFVQLALNFAWSPVFFGAHDIKLGKILILAMLVIALAAAAQFRRIRPAAGWLMLPYLLWLCFAWALNSSIDQLNPGAGTSLLG